LGKQTVTVGMVAGEAMLASLLLCSDLIKARLYYKAWFK